MQAPKRQSCRRSKSIAKPPRLRVMSKAERQNAFKRSVENLSATEAVKQASLFPSVDPDEFVPVFMPL